MKYIIIPNEVAYSTKITNGAKLLYGLILAIYRNKKQTVRASNAFFAEQFGTTERQIQRWLHSLAEEGLINIRMKRDSKGYFVERNLLPTR